VNIKIKPADKWFSLLARERAEHRCECCGKYCGPDHSGGRLDCSHIFSRRHKATRWHPSNSVAHCFTCHQYLGGNPLEFSAWAEKYLGHGLLEIIREQHHMIVKCGKRLEKEIAKELKRQYDEMMQKRADGITGRIEFDGWTF
jgi:hypothetical protein